MPIMFMLVLMQTENANRNSSCRGLFRAAGSERAGTPYFRVAQNLPIEVRANSADDHWLGVWVSPANRPTDWRGHNDDWSTFAMASLNRSKRVEQETCQTSRRLKPTQANRPCCLVHHDDLRKKSAIDFAKTIYPRRTRLFTSLRTKLPIRLPRLRKMRSGPESTK